MGNACPRCDWFSESLSDWPKWNGVVPKESLEQDSSEAVRESTPLMTAASAEIALRICYSARALWQLGPTGEVQQLRNKLVNWEPLTAADGVDHPVQLLLALAIADNVPEEALGLVPMMSMLNEVCARRARDELRQAAGTDQPAVSAAARKRVAGFLGVSNATAPQTRPLVESEPTQAAVREECCGDYSLESSCFDFKDWVRGVLEPWTPPLVFVKRLRAVLRTREGGWPQLATDMETGPHKYADVVQILQKPMNKKENLRTFLGIAHPAEAPRILATIAAQAFLHQSSQLRRTVALGGTLKEPLGDVRDGNTLREMCVDLRMAVYEERVAAKMREWGQVGASLTYQRAYAADLEQYSHMCGVHVHGLDKPTFWGLWNAATGEKAKQFLSTSNHGFQSKYGHSAK